MQALKSYNMILVPTVSHPDCSSNLPTSQNLGEELGCSCPVCLSDQQGEVMNDSLLASFGPVAQ